MHQKNGSKKALIKNQKILPNYQSHHVPALRPRKGDFISFGERHQTVRTRMRTVPFPVLHVPPFLESLNGLKVIQTWYIIHRQWTLTRLPINGCINQERFSLEWQSLALRTRRRKMSEWLRFDIGVEANGV